MLRLERVIHGILLNYEDTGENFSRLTFFSKTGLVRCLFRKKHKLSGVSSPDLFDDVEVNLQLKNGQGIPFIKEHNIIKKRTKLGQNHSTFEASGFLARFFITNGEHLLEPKIFFSILDNALSSLLNHGMPSTVLLKTLFLFAREEGLPVRESWLSGLRKEDLNNAHFIISRPVSESLHLKMEIIRLLESLCNWLRSDTELYC